jgi:hypothetical protein
MDGQGRTIQIGRLSPAACLPLNPFASLPCPLPSALARSSSLSGCVSFASSLPLPVWDLRFCSPTTVGLAVCLAATAGRRLTRRKRNCVLRADRKTDSTAHEGRERGREEEKRHETGSSRPNRRESERAQCCVRDRACPGVEVVFCMMMRMYGFRLCARKTTITERAEERKGRGRE